MSSVAALAGTGGQQQHSPGSGHGDGGTPSSGSDSPGNEATRLSRLPGAGGAGGKGGDRPNRVLAAVAKFEGHQESGATESGSGSSSGSVRKAVGEFEQRGSGGDGTGPVRKAVAAFEQHGRSGATKTGVGGGDGSVRKAVAALNQARRSAASGVGKGGSGAPRKPGPSSSTVITKVKLSRRSDASGSDSQHTHQASASAPGDQSHGTSADKQPRAPSPVRSGSPLDPQARPTMRSELSGIRLSRPVAASGAGGRGTSADQQRGAPAGGQQGAQGPGAGGAADTQQPVQAPAAAGAGGQPPPPPGGGAGGRRPPLSRAGSGPDAAAQQGAAANTRSDGSPWPQRPDLSGLPATSLDNIEVLADGLFNRLQALIHLDADLLPATDLLGGARYSNMLPPAHSAVAVNVDGTAQHIHGNWLDGSTIVAQGPMSDLRSPVGLAAFLAAVLDSGVGNIVNLTDGWDATNPSLQAEYWPPEGTTQHHALGNRAIAVTTQSVTHHNGYEVVSLRLSEPGAQPQQVTVYRFTGWPQFNAPATEAASDQLMNFIRAAGSGADVTNTLVHSDAGMGRAGTFVVLNRLFEGIEAGVINQGNLVEQIGTLIWEGRISRGAEYVQTPAQVAMLIGYGLVALGALDDRAGASPAPQDGAPSQSPPPSPPQSPPPPPSPGAAGIAAAPAQGPDAPVDDAPASEPPPPFNDDNYLSWRFRADQVNQAAASDSDQQSGDAPTNNQPAGQAPADDGQPASAPVAAGGFPPPPPPGGGGAGRRPPLPPMGGPADQPAASGSQGFQWNGRLPTRSDGTPWPAAPDVSGLAAAGLDSAVVVGGRLFDELAGTQIHLPRDFVRASLVAGGVRDSYYLPPSNSAVRININGATRRVNANWIDHSNIAAQGPSSRAASPGSAAAFFTMVLDSGSGHIVNLTGQSDASASYDPVYWPGVGETEQFVLRDRIIDVTTQSITPHNGYDIAVLDVLDQSSGQSETVSVYHFTGWEAFDVPTRASRNDFQAFMQSVNAGVGNDTVVVHGDAGVGRTGTFIALRQMLSGINAGTINQANLVESVNSLIWEGRINRGPEYVQTASQVALLLEAGLAEIERLSVGGGQQPHQMPPGADGGNAPAPVAQQGPAGGNAPAQAVQQGAGGDNAPAQGAQQGAVGGNAPVDNGQQAGPAAAAVNADAPPPPPPPLPAADGAALQAQAAAQAAQQGAVGGNAPAQAAQQGAVGGNAPVDNGQQAGPAAAAVNADAPPPPPPPPPLPAADGAGLQAQAAVQVAPPDGGVDPQAQAAVQGAPAADANAAEQEVPQGAVGGNPEEQAGDAPVIAAGGQPPPPPPPGGGAGGRRPPQSAVGSGPTVTIEQGAEANTRSDGSAWPSRPDVSDLPPVTTTEPEDLGDELFGRLAASDGPPIHLDTDFLSSPDLLAGARYPTIRAPSHSAVAVNVNGADRHVHANWISSSTIAAQGPMSTSEGLAAFFATTLDNGVGYVVNLTGSSDADAPNLEMVYWPPEGATQTHVLGDRTITVTTHSVVQHDGYEVISLEVFEHGSAEPQSLTIYRFDEWPLNNVPATEEASDHLINLMMALENRADDRNMLVHSDAGTGRTGTFIVLAQLFEGIQNGSIDEDNLIEQISALVWNGRINRGPEFVESSSQMTMLIAYGLAALDLLGAAGEPAPQDDDAPGAPRDSRSPTPPPPPPPPSSGAAGIAPAPGQGPDAGPGPDDDARTSWLLNQYQAAAASSSARQGDAAAVNNAAQAPADDGAPVNNAAQVPADDGAPVNNAAQAPADDGAPVNNADQAPADAGAPVNNADQASADGGQVPAAAVGAVPPPPPPPPADDANAAEAVPQQAAQQGDIGGDAPGQVAQQQGVVGGNPEGQAPDIGDNPQVAAAGGHPPPPPPGGGAGGQPPQPPVGSAEPAVPVQQADRRFDRRSDGTPWPTRPVLGDLPPAGHDNAEGLGIELFARLDGVEIHRDEDFLPAAEVVSGIRYRNILPPAHSAVAVDVNGVNRYVHGNWVSPSTIVAQAPMIGPDSPDGLAAFFATALDNGVGYVVDLTDDQGAAAASSQGPYWPAVGATEQHIIGDRVIDVTTRSVIQHEGYEIAALGMFEQGSDVSELLTVYRFTEWPQYDVPGTQEASDRLIHFMRELGDRTNDRHLLVHSDSGTGRTGTFVVLAQLFEGIQSGSIDRANLVEQIGNMVWEGRINRGPDFVQTPDQLIMLLTYGLTALDLFDAVAPQDDDAPAAPRDSEPPAPPPPPPPPGAAGIAPALAPDQGPDARMSWLFNQYQAAASSSGQGGNAAVDNQPANQAPVDGDQAGAPGAAAADVHVPPQQQADDGFAADVNVPPQQQADDGFAADANVPPQQQADDGFEWPAPPPPPSSPPPQVDDGFEWLAPPPADDDPNNLDELVSPPSSPVDNGNPLGPDASDEDALVQAAQQGVVGGNPADQAPGAVDDPQAAAGGQPPLPPGGGDGRQSPQAGMGAADNGESGVRFNIRPRVRPDGTPWPAAPDISHLPTDRGLSAAQIGRGLFDAMEGPSQQIHRPEDFIAQSSLQGGARYHQILPPEGSVVEVEVNGAARPVHGNWVAPGVIVAQGPMNQAGDLAGVATFFATAMDNGVDRIVNLTGDSDVNNATLEQQYWPDMGEAATHTVGDRIITVTNRAEQFLGGFRIVTLELQDHGSGQTRTVEMYHFAGWPGGGVPTAADMDSLSTFVDMFGSDSGTGTTLIHSDSGTDRAGSFAVLTQLLAGITAGTVSHANLVESVRDLIWEGRIARGPAFARNPDQLTMIVEFGLAALESAHAAAAADDELPPASPPPGPGAEAAPQDLPPASGAQGVQQPDPAAPQPAPSPMSRILSMMAFGQLATPDGSQSLVSEEQWRGLLQPLTADQLYMLAIHPEAPLHTGNDEYPPMLTQVAYEAYAEVYVPEVIRSQGSADQANTMIREQFTGYPGHGLMMALRRVVERYSRAEAMLRGVIQQHRDGQQ